jgi:peptidoglycan/xylan/chitin deacetylase (PgdA/CDA1 family)
VCADEIAGQSWIPPHFVSASQFAGQMDILRRFGPVVHLPEVVGQLADGRLDQAAFAITFDDVPACSFVHARPILDRFGIRASFFIATGYVGTGRLFPGDVLRLLRIWPDERARTGLACELARHKRMTIGQLKAALNQAEQAWGDGLPTGVRGTLQPMSWDQVRQLADEGHEIGGHTVDHVVLGWQPTGVREQQIRACLAELETRLARKVLGFAYPNGGPGDFGPTDQATLSDCAVRYAVSTRTASVRDADLLALPRVCIGAAHTAETFALELSGLLDGRRQRQQGWR